MDLKKVGLVLAVFAAIFTYCLVFLLLAMGKKDTIKTKERLKNIGKLNTFSPLERTEKKEKSRFSFIKVSDDFARMLLAADIKFKPQEFIVFWACFTVLPPLICLLFTDNLLTVMGAMAIGFSIPFVMIKVSRQKRLTAFNKQLGDALLIMANCLRSGFTFRYAMERVAEDLPNPIAEEFARVVREVNFGMSMDESLKRLAERMQSPEMELVNSAVAIQQKAGGNLASIIDKVAATIRERIQIQNSVKALTAQGRYSGLLIGLLPIVLALFFTVSNPSYMEVLFTTTIGQIMLVLGVVLEVIGFIVIRKMTDVKY